MTSKEEIKKYLSLPEKERDYTAGYNLFCRFSKNIPVQRYLARKQDRAKLFYKLECILQQDKIIESKIANEPVIVNANLTSVNADSELKEIEKKTQRINPDELPEKEREIFKKIQLSYKDMRFNYESMKKATSDEVRANHRAVIVKLNAEVRSNWQILDEFVKSKPSEETKEEEVKEIPSAKEINAARVYLSKNLPKLESMPDEEKALLIPKLKDRYNLLISAENNFDENTITILNSHGIIETDTNQEN